MSVESAQISMIRRIAYRMLRRLPDSVDVGELISDGYFGLLDALKRYDVSRGRPFENFAAPRIRGAMLDGLRARDCLPRTFRAAKDHVPEFVPLDEEMPSPPEVRRLEIVELSRQSLEGLTRRARLTLQLYYLEGLSMRQIGTCLGVTEARVSQLHARTLRALRQRWTESD